VLGVANYLRLLRICEPSRFSFGAVCELSGIWLSGLRRGKFNLSYCNLLLSLNSSWGFQWAVAFEG
jgi:hypothetical protein